MKEQEDKLNFENGEPIFCITPIEDSLQQVYNNYKALSGLCNYLMEENKRLKSESYKDEELSKMKKDYDRMKKDYLRGFPISEEEFKKISEWCEKNFASRNASFHYEFFPTALGVSGKIVDDYTKQKFEFKEIS